MARVTRQFVNTHQWNKKEKTLPLHLVAQYEENNSHDLFGIGLVDSEFDEPREAMDINKLSGA